MERGASKESTRGMLFNFDQRVLRKEVLILGAYGAHRPGAALMYKKVNEYMNGCMIKYTDI